LCHHEKRCTRGRIVGRRRDLEALGRHGPVTIFSRPHVTNPPAARKQTLKGPLALGFARNLDTVRSSLRSFEGRAVPVVRKGALCRVSDGTRSALLFIDSAPATAGPDLTRSVPPSLP
jgi:hypothetical protein